MRLPTSGGSAALYQPDSLTTLDWEIRSGVPPMVRALGTDLDDRMVYGVDKKGEVVGIDLISKKPRPYLSRISLVTGSADGVILGVDSAQHPERFLSRSLTMYNGAVAEREGTILVRARGNLIAAYNSARGFIQIFDEDGELRRIEVPTGQLSSSWFGDLLMVTSETGITLIDPQSDAPPNFVKIPGMPLAGVFSPSAHRVYVARARGDILLLDRFDPSREVGKVKIPGAVSDLRADRSGRWLLAHQESSDSVWLIDLVRQELVVTLFTDWAEDLPMITEGRTLLIRQGEDLVAFDIAGALPIEIARQKKAAKDIYLWIPWAPRDNYPAEQQMASQPTELATTSPTPEDPMGLSAKTASDSGGTDSLPGERPNLAIYIQVTSSQNEPWARNLAEQLRAIGFRSKVLDPPAPGDGFKVVVGPYASREEADADGKLLGRPYFITTPDSPGT